VGGREEGTATDWVIGSLVREPRGIILRFGFGCVGVGLLLETSGAFVPFGLAPSWAMGLFRLATLICMEKAFRLDAPLIRNAFLTYLKC
jgi:hypothetical protein